MKNNDTPSFLDSRTLIAVALVGLTFVGWQSYMQKKYPGLYDKKAKVEEAAPAVKTEPSAAKSIAAPTDAAAPANTAETLTPYAGDNFAFSISSKGMGIKTFQILPFKTRSGETVEIGQAADGYLSLETRLMGHTEPLDFKIEKVNPNLFVGHAQIGNVRITKTMEIDPSKYLLQFKIVASGTDDRFIGLTTALTDEVEPVASKIPLLPKFQKQEFFIETSETHERMVFGKDDQTKNWSGVKLASLGSQYFTEAVLDRSPIIPEARGHIDHKGKVATLLLQYPVLNHAQDFQLEYAAYAGPKSHDLLQSIDPSFARVVDFGFFNWIGRQILQLLKLLHGVLGGNWGLAIIGLTVLVRLLVLPLNIYSYKSMKVMQVLQPQIQALRERYKDDQQKQQQEMMSLMKAHKANPLAGCLPVLLQFPIFIALYQVLGNSVELYQAPFGLWIHDLSLKDPFYVLPVLMGITMFVQQKITPNTMDPAQAKMMLLMPIVFTFFMISLPSGLTLYMLVGAAFSVCQQAFFLKKGPVFATPAFSSQTKKGL